jgi:hypothetical protein
VRLFVFYSYISVYSLKKVQRNWNSLSWSLGLVNRKFACIFLCRFVVTQPKSDARGGDPMSREEVNYGQGRLLFKPDYGRHGRRRRRSERAAVPPSGRHSRPQETPSDALSLFFPLP